MVVCDPERGKSKTKGKKSMKKALAWLLVIAMTAALAVGGTLAYLTDTDEDVNVMTVGKVKIDQLEYERVDPETNGDDAVVQEFRDNKPLLPAVTEDGFTWDATTGTVDWEQIGKEDYVSGIWNPEDINNEVDKMVFVKNKGDYDAYVRTVIAFEAGNYTTIDEFRSKVHLNLNETDWDWTWTEAPVSIGEGSYFVATATYNKVLAPGALTEISLSQIALDPSATNADVAGFGDTYQVLVQSQAVQADGFDNPNSALNEAFGTIPNDIGEYPFDGDSPTRGIDLKTALNNLDGNPATPITSQVSKIVFGKTADYASIADNYDGTLMDVEQDVPAYVYYVPDGSNYVVYCLSNGTVYSPKDSTELCRNMSALTEVDTSNFDVSRTENMFRMFQNCGKLATIDTSKWDTSSVTNMARTFQACASLTALDVSDWDVSNVTNMYCLFGGSEQLTTLDVSKWDVSNVTDMAYMFWHVYALEELDVANWDVGNVTTFEDFFAGRQNLGNIKVKKLEVENWDVSSAVSLRDMFYGCAQLTSLDLSKWDVSNVKDMRHTFADCFNLESIDFTGWDISQCENFDGTFNDCMKLSYLDLSSWDTGNAVTFTQMFEGCRDLKTIVGIENWNTSKVRDVSELFNSNGRGMTIETLDLSGWDTSAMTATYTMFNGCSQLTTVYVGDGWDMTNATASYSMFSGCTSLTGEFGTTVEQMNSTDKTYARADVAATADSEAVPGYFTYKSAE